METTLTNVNAYENAVRTQAGAADIRAQLLDSLAKSKAVVDSVFGKIEEIDRMKAESRTAAEKDFHSHSGKGDNADDAFRPLAACLWPVWRCRLFCRYSE